jgi:hypothetical protein
MPTCHSRAMKTKPLMSVAAVALAAVSLSVPMPALPAEKPTAEPTRVVTVRVPGNPRPQYKDWRDAPLAEGSWSYAEGEETSSASFISESKPRFRISCDHVSKRVTLTRFGVIAAVGSDMTVRTKTLERSVPAHAPDRKVFETLAYLDAGDTLLDAIALANDRFAVELAKAPLFLPGSGEVARVIEDCR